MDSWTLCFSGLVKNIPLQLTYVHTLFVCILDPARPSKADCNTYILEALEDSKMAQNAGENVFGTCACLRVLHKLTCTYCCCMNFYRILQIKRLLSFLDEEKNWTVCRRVNDIWGVVLCCPCLFCPSDTFEHCLVLPTRWRASVRHFSLDICCVIQEGVITV